MWMMMLAASALANTPCPPPEIVAAASAVEDAKETRTTLRTELLGQNWAARQATEDRDAVRAEERSLRDALKDARVGVRDAKRALGEVEDGFDKEELACEPSASVSTPTGPSAS